MSSAGTACRTTSRLWIVARPSTERLHGSSNGDCGALSVRVTWSLFAGTRAPLNVNPLGASFKARVISPENPSFRTEYTVMGTDAPARTLTLAGTTRKAKSGRGALMRSR